MILVAVVDQPQYVLQAYQPQHSQLATGRGGGGSHYSATSADQTGLVTPSHTALRPPAGQGRAERVPHIQAATNRDDGTQVATPLP